MLTACKRIPFFSVLRYPYLTRLLRCSCAVKSVATDYKVNSVRIFFRIINCRVKFINRVSPVIAERRGHKRAHQSILYKIAVRRCVCVLARSDKVVYDLCIRRVFALCGCVKRKSAFITAVCDIKCIAVVERHSVFIILAKGIISYITVIYPIAVFKREFYARRIVADIIKHICRPSLKCISADNDRIFGFYSQKRIVAVLCKNRRQGQHKQNQAQK